MACCWVSRATLVVLKDHPLYRQDLFVGVVCWGGVLCENCIVDANAIIINGNGNNLLLLFVFLFCGFCSWYFLLSVREMFVFFVLGRTVDAWVC